MRLEDVFVWFFFVLCWFLLRIIVFGKIVFLIFYFVGVGVEMVLL